MIAPYVLGGKYLADVVSLAVKGSIYVAGALILALMLLMLNTPVIRLYENGLLLSRWLKVRNQKAHEKRYTALVERRQTYQKALEAEETMLSSSVELERAIATLEGVHEKIEQTTRGRPILPHDRAFVMPTALGNSFAVIEEYPYERYQMDAMIFWPRLVAVIPEDYKSQIADLKTTLDLNLNLSLLATLFGVVSLAVGFWFAKIDAVIYGLLAQPAAYGLYRLAVRTTHELGEPIMSCFDLFRGALLDRYGIPRPASLIAEQRIWTLLAGFIKRGELFYFPLGAQAAAGRALLQQELGQRTHNLYKLRLQAAQYGIGETPLHLLNQIEEEEREIVEIKTALATRDAESRSALAPSDTGRGAIS